MKKQTKKLTIEGIIKSLPYDLRQKIKDSRKRLPPTQEEIVNYINVIRVEKGLKPRDGSSVKNAEES